MKKITSLIMAFVLTIIMTTPHPAEAAVKICKSKAVLEVDATIQLKITGTKSKVTWKTSKKSVATVNQNGLVTAIKEGQATITATVDKQKYSCIITVVDSSVEQLTAKKGTITELSTGTYIIGEDFPAGKYNVKAIKGSGNFFVTGNDTYVNEILAEEGNEFWDNSTYSNLRLLYGDEMEITGGLVLEFKKLD